jgi:hypothetical protein
MGLYQRVELTVDNPSPRRALKDVENIRHDIRYDVLVGVATGVDFLEARDGAGRVGVSRHIDARDQAPLGEPEGTSRLFTESCFLERDMYNKSRE